MFREYAHVPSSEIARLASKQTIRLCILNDSVYPVFNISSMRSVVHEVSNQLDSVANIELRIIDIKLYPYVYHNYDSLDQRYGDMQARLVGAFCSPRTDIVIILTSKWTSRYGGYAWPRNDIIILFYFESVLNGYLVDVNGDTYPINVLKHELGHIFGIERHSEDSTSFMHDPVFTGLPADAWNHSEVSFLRTRRKTIFGGWRRPSS